MNTNLILGTDSYKASHQYPKGTTGYFGYVESRGGEFDSTVFFGPQGFFKNYLCKRVSKTDVAEAEEFFQEHGEPFPKRMWLRVANELNGRVPLRIRAVPEGSVVPTSNVLLTVESTDPETAGLGSWMETQILRSVWYGTTVCTQSYMIKKLLTEYLKRSSDGDPDQEVLFKLHDFGARGVSSAESAGIGGAAHLVNFRGSDTVEGILWARHNYKCRMAGYSIPASEHSMMTSEGPDGEAKVLESIIKSWGGPGKLFACVGDSYSIRNFCREIVGVKCRDMVMNNGGKLVVRPDSGDPATIVLQVLNDLGDKFGSTTNSKGYKVLPPYLGVIQGDGINRLSIVSILDTILSNGWSASNVAFGMGGALLTKGIDRDTLKFAMKCSSLIVNGVARDVFKSPETDLGKASKRGRLDLVLDNGAYSTVKEGISPEKSVLRTVFENGELIIDDTFESVRNRAV